MFLKMLAFEWRYYVRQPSFYVTSLIFFLLPFFAMVSENVRIGGGNTIYNGSLAITQTLLIMGIFSMFLVVNFIANTATRNETSKMSEILYSKPINPLQYQLGRFMGSYLVILTVFAMVPLGTLVGSIMPWVDNERLGPTNLSYYLTTFFYFSVPTLFFLSCLFYAVGVRMRSMMAVYLAAMAVFLFYLISGTFVNEPEYRHIAALSDPFGVRTFADISRYWTTIERDTQVLTFDGVLLQNRLIWLSAGAVVLLLFGQLHKRLTLNSPKMSRKDKKALKIKSQWVAQSSDFSRDVSKESVNSSLGSLSSNKIDYKGSGTNNFEKFKTRTAFEIKQIMLSPPFYILLLFSLVNIIAAFFVPGSMYGTSDWPLTQLMVDQIYQGFSLMVIVVITYYSGEVVWRERSAGMGDIVDSMPVFNLTFWLSKLIAVSLTIVALFVLGMLITISYQLISGVTDIQLSQYFISLFFFYAPGMIMMVVLAFFFQVISSNKFIGMLLFVGYFIASLTFYQLGLEHNLANFAAAPQLQYSDLNGYGWYVETQAWYLVYWGAFSVILGTISYALWQRGPQVALSSRIKMLSYQLERTGKTLIASAAVIFVLSGSYIYYNTTVLNEYLSSDEQMDLQAEYEHTYDKYLKDKLPIIKKVNAIVDISPQSRTIAAKAIITVVNKSNIAIEKFLVNKPQNVVEWDVNFPGGSLQKFNKELGTAWFVFDNALEPGQSIDGEMKVVRTVKGFKDKGFDVQVVENGTFINNFELFPTFGVNNGFYLSDRFERRKRDLPPPKRANKLEESEYYTENFFGNGVDFIDFETTVSTDIDQIAIAPGYLQKEWVEDGKRYFHYKMDAPILNFYSFLSARLDVKKEVHNGVNVEVYYHPAHAMNVDVMIESTKDSIDYFTEAFGPYQHKQMRIIEFPGYRSFAQSFANTVPYSENIGFTTDLRDPENMDPVYYVTAHELAHQWWAHQVGAANVQGRAILSETLSQYSAIMVMAKKYGDEKLRKFLKYELDRYLRGRTSEILEEMPLMRSESQAYIHYNKGSVVMMSIKDRIGEERLNTALKNLLERFKFRSDPFPTTIDLLSSLTSVSNEEERQFIKSLFEDITLYDLKAKTVEVVEQEDGKFEVTLVFDANRYTADGKGVETKMELNEYIDIVLFNADPEDLTAENLVLYQHKHLIKTGENEIKIIVDKRPVYAGIDPFVKLIDRDSDDNLLKL